MVLAAVYGCGTAFDNKRNEGDTNLLLSLDVPFAPDAATAGTPIPGKVESPQLYKPLTLMFLGLCMSVNRNRYTSKKIA